MSIRKRGVSTLTLAALAVGPMLVGCASKQKKAPPPPPPTEEAAAEPAAAAEKAAEAAPAEKAKPALKKARASVASAEHTGAAAPGQPKITLKGEAPDGWKIEVAAKAEDKKVTLTVWAVPAEGATEAGANKAYEHVHVMNKMEGGPWKVHVMNEKNMETKFFEFSY